MREKHRFEDLFNEGRRVVIPIIQRDYAQGRNSKKALTVRKRLIEDWITVLSSEDQYMDFNFVYGSESEDGSVFFPVDGQQRLTSLYLLHWYLAFSTGNVTRISNWCFDYRTRNSASEFFEFLRDTTRSEQLYYVLVTIIPNEEVDKINKRIEKKEKNGEIKEALVEEAKNEWRENEIKNQAWYKNKWENDPTIDACVRFLVLLVSQLRMTVQEEQVTKAKYDENKFWHRLTEDSESDSDLTSAVCFTKLCQKGNDSELAAAKQYTRMNARGKDLTDFENLKAMLDEIEDKFELDYCVEDCEEKVSCSYDRVYIHTFYSFAKENLSTRDLEAITKEINKKSYDWYEFIYQVYCSLYGVKYVDKENYEDVIYRISQGQKTDDENLKTAQKNIREYMLMLKAVQEVLCNSTGDVLKSKCVFYNDMLKEAFVIFVYRMWTPKYTTDDNIKLLDTWEEFKNVLEDLDYSSWNQNKEGCHRIISEIAVGISKESEKTVSRYFLKHGFDEKIDSLLSQKVRPDIKCRVLEQKIISKLLTDNVIENRTVIKGVIDNSNRYGNLFYIAGFLEDWSLGDWSHKEKWTGNKLCKICDLYRDNQITSANLQSNVAMMKWYALASQYDEAKEELKSSAVINQCNNEHIWKDRYCSWLDNEFSNVVKEKMTQLNHLRTMTDLLLNRINKSALLGAGGANMKEAFEHALGEFVADCFNKPEYADCWLRIACENADETIIELLRTPLQNHDGTVFFANEKQVIKPYIIWTYLKKMGYVEAYNGTVVLNGVTNQARFSHKGIVLTEAVTRHLSFTPTDGDANTYRHSKNPKRELSVTKRTRHIELEYRRNLSFSSDPNGYCSVHMENDNIVSATYDNIGTKDGKYLIQKNELVYDATVRKTFRNGIINWTNCFDSIEKSPEQDNCYDIWLNIWFGAYDEVSVLERINPTHTSHGQNPKRRWEKVQTVSANDVVSSSSEIIAL